MLRILHLRDGDSVKGPPHPLRSNKSEEPQGGHQRIPACSLAVPRSSPRWQLSVPKAHTENTATMEAKHGCNLVQHREHSSFHDCGFILRRGLPQTCDVAAICFGEHQLHCSGLIEENLPEDQQLP